MLTQNKAVFISVVGQHLTPYRNLLLTLCHPGRECIIIFPQFRHTVLMSCCIAAIRGVAFHFVLPKTVNATLDALHSIDIDTRKLISGFVARACLVGILGVRHQMPCQLAGWGTGCLIA